MVRRADDVTGKEEKILVLETDVQPPQAGQECDDTNLYMVLRQLERLREDVESTYGNPKQRDPAMSPINRTETDASIICSQNPVT